MDIEKVYYLLKSILKKGNDQISEDINYKKAYLNLKNSLSDLLDELHYLDDSDLLFDDDDEQEDVSKIKEFDVLEDLI